jgi:hypothetical protein
VAVLLGGIATPAAAADVTVGAVAASQFDSGLFIALVTATGVTTLIDAQLVVNNTTPIVPAAVESYALGGPRNATLSKIVSYTKVVSPGDTLTAIVTDVNGTHGIRTVVCGRGLSAFHIVSVCR